ncbi:hypothetical protein IKL64_02890 [bacterium]|nr:hypothetical protein [bacterium]
MLKEEIKNLLFADEFALDSNKINCNLLRNLDEYILSMSVSESSITPEVFNIYKKFVSMKQEAPESMKNELFSAMKNYIKERISAGAYLDALFMYRFLIVKSTLSPSSYYDVAEILFNLGQNDLSFEFISLYEQYETNKPLRLLTLANFYNLQVKNYKMAIKYYEQYLRIDETKAVVYTIVATLYAKEYGELSLKDQIYYFEKAYKLKPKDRLVLHSLAFGYEKYGDKVRANRFYQELLENNPTPTDFYNYGAFLISCGEFQLGHKYFTKRFETGDVNLQYPVAFDLDKKWDLKSDISEKILLVHYEQGFGDTFMYCRFVPYLKNLAKKVIFVVQNEVFELLKSSKFLTGIKLVSADEDLSKVKYDVHMALLDAPFVLKIRSEDIPVPEGYLKVSPTRVKEYAKKYIKSTKNIKVGIAYQGDKSANYNGRDIDFTRFNRLFNLEGFDFYSLTKEIVESEKVVSLGDTFNDFTDTACAIKNMDIVVSTDNVILNLAGSLGVKTYGLFNKHANFRWYKLSGDSVGWYDSVKPLQVEENNCWSEVFSELINILCEYRKK